MYIVITSLLLFSGKCFMITSITLHILNSFQTNMLFSVDLRIIDEQMRKRKTKLVFQKFNVIGFPFNLYMMAQKHLTISLIFLFQEMQDGLLLIQRCSVRSHVAISYGHSLGVESEVKTKNLYTIHIYYE